MDVGRDTRMIDSECSSDEPRTPRNNGFLLNLERIESKSFNDSVHGHFRLRPSTCAFVDTKPFQRLRRLKQLGFCYYVYPGASHNRFEHSLGVASLSGKWTETLMRSDSESHNEIERCASLLEIAGLCHDLGHGPFSHAWEHSILPALGMRNWSHEAMSLELVGYIFDAYDIYDVFGLGRADMNLIQDLIIGKKPRSTNGIRDFPVYLFDIVNNKMHGVDVDKLDYLQRDSMYTNVKVAAPYDRLMQFIQPRKNSIHFRLTERENLDKVFRDRATLHKDVYTHKTSKAIELMVADAMKAVGPELRLAERSQKVGEFLKLTDGIMDTVLDHYESPSQGTKTAKTLLTRIERRDLYTLSGELRIPEERIPSVLQMGINPVDITSCQDADGTVNLRPDDICVDLRYIDRGMGNADPLDKIHFYTERETDISAIDVFSQPLQQLWVRVFCKEKQNESAVKHAFDQFRRYNSLSPSMNTPERREY